jgi:preprotein translocase subunit YajC
VPGEACRARSGRRCRLPRLGRVPLAQEAGASGLSSLLFFAVLIGGMYLLLIRPQRVRARQMSRVQSALGVGTRVMTTAGLIATVTQVDDDDTVLLEIAPGVQARFARQAVARVLEEPGAGLEDLPGEGDGDEPGTDRPGPAGPA